MTHALATAARINALAPPAAGRCPHQNRLSQSSGDKQCRRQQRLPHPVSLQHPWCVSQGKQS